MNEDVSKTTNDNRSDPKSIRYISKYNYEAAYCLFDF